MPSRAPEFEARRTEVEMPAVDMGVPPPRSGAVREFAPQRESLSVPWAESPEQAAHVSSSSVRQAAHRRGAPLRDDADADEVTSEAQPFLVGEFASPASPRAPAPATVERRKTPVPAAAVPPASAPKGGLVPDARSGTMEVSLAELEAALSASASPAEGRPGEARPGAHEEDAEELTRSQKLEAQLIARRAWAELAQLYLKRADQAKDATLRADALARLAEVMENELHDPAGAARMYREIVALTGDRAALRDQVRLLAARGDASLVRRALDEAIRRAPSSRARAGALLTRGERWLHMGELKKARADFEAAEVLAPGLPAVLAGLLRCVEDAERPDIAERLRALLAAMPRRALDRVDALRVLAQVAEESLGNPRLAQWAWSEVLAESPDSDPARMRLTVLARRLGDTTVLGQLLRAQLARESRGPAAREARLELVATLEAQGNAEAALDELRQAVRYEPGHKEAWLMLVERLLQREQLGEAAWALEHAATATEDEEERERTWERLARLWREVMGNPERAQIYARRAEGIRQARAEREVLPPPEPPRSASPRREPSGPRAPLVPAPPVLSHSPANIEQLANEVTSTTDPGAVLAAARLPPPASPQGGSDREASGNASPAGAEPAPSARKGRRARGSGRARSSSVDAEEGAPRRGRSRASRGDESSPASAPGNAAAPVPREPAPEAAATPRNPASVPGTATAPVSRNPAFVEGTAAASRSPASVPGTAAASRSPASVPGTAAASRNPASVAGTAAAPAPRNLASVPGTAAAPAPRNPASVPGTAAAPAPRNPASVPGTAAVPASRNPAPVQGTAAAPAPRAPAPSGDAADAAGFPKVPQSPAPGRKGRGVERAAPAARDAEPAPASQDAAARERRSGATDLITGELMDLGAAPVPETRVISWEAPPGRMDPVRRVVRARPEGTVSAPAPGRTFIAKPPATPEPPRPAPGASETRESPAPAYLPSQDTEPDGFRHIRERPLDAKPYRSLAEYFDQRGDPARASLMREIADALEGLETPAPRGQRPPLTSDERAGLRHPGLRTPSGELLACTGIALCRLFPAEGRAAGSSELLRATAGPAAPAVLDALHSAARMLDVHLPELVLAEDDGPPFTAVHAGHARLLVGRLLLREPMPAAELRFHAGRALLSLSPDLLALRALKGGQLLRALALLSTVLKDPRASGEEARVVRESLSPKALERAMALLEPGTRDFKASALADAARDSANRAGLVACGSVGPALTVLRARKGNEAELVELLRFAASERYLPLRAPR
ncbi:tetratricopeptide repeat protein [Myxococcus sp. Y35]|uniref:tetratricopeptide repeat protein n=1 Tax=Pseudomyxococcus flavus TaxID=3115648 RepID=UPI003CF1521E